MLLTSRARVLRAVAASPRASFSELAGAAGLEERQVRRIVRDLDVSGYLTYTRAGRRNGYRVNLDAPLTKDSIGTVGELLALLERDERMT